MFYKNKDEGLFYYKPYKEYKYFTLYNVYKVERDFFRYLYQESFTKSQLHELLDCEHELTTYKNLQNMKRGLIV